MIVIKNKVSNIPIKQFGNAAASGVFIILKRYRSKPL